MAQLHKLNQSCRKFEFAGILCSHALKVLSANNIKTIPSQYISKRWTKDIRDEIPKVSCPNANNDDPKAKIARRYRDLARLHTELATIAAESDEAYEIASVALHKTLADVKASLKNKTSQEAPINSSAPEVVSDDLDEHRVKGIMVKERIVRKEDSIRPKNALEKLLGNKRHRKEVDTSSRHQREPELDRSNVASTCIPPTQVQLQSTQQMELQTYPSLVDSMTVPASQTQMNEQEVNVNKSGVDICMHDRVLPQPSHSLQTPQSIMHVRMEQFMKQNHGAQFSEVLHINNIIDKPNALPPQMQFTSPFQHFQNSGGFNVPDYYPQSSIYNELSARFHIKLSTRFHI